MSNESAFHQLLEQNGVSRRSFLKYCAATASILAIPQALVPEMVAAVEQAKRPAVIWLSMQECTGCTESLTRSHTPSIESLIFNHVSLDYHHTLQAASGHNAEKAREESIEKNKGKYLLLVDGSIPAQNNGYSTIAGISNVEMLKESAKHAAAVISIGTCAANGGLPGAYPNPTGAVSVGEIVKDKPVINIPGCPPIPIVITAVLVHYLTFQTLPELDKLRRPKAFYGKTIHDRCYRRTFYERGLFAESFDDEAAKQGYCLYKLGCKGPTTYNACATTKWNEGAGFPIEGGHGCLGCSEPKFWDAGSFYQPVSKPITDSDNLTLIGVGAGVVAGTALAAYNIQRKKSAQKDHQPVTLEQLEE